MKTVSTQIPGLVIIEPQVFGDQRGYFMESYNARRYREVGLPGKFSQDNISCSRRGVLRGLHFQQPNSQGKLVHVLEGEVFDVGVDLRRGSPTFGHWFGVYLSGENKRQFYVPEGFAHGFCVTSDRAVFAYKCTAHYDPSSEKSIRWDDPDIGITWPITDPTLSDKDRGAVRLDDFPNEDLPVYRPARPRLFASREQQPKPSRPRALIIGSSGQIGRELCRSLQYQYDVVPAGRRAQDKPTIDLSNAESIRRTVRETHPQLIVNAGAYTAVDRAQEETHLAMTVNGDAVRILAEEAKRIDAAMVHYSTDYIFSGEGDAPWKEEDSPSPPNEYGRSKLAGDLALRDADVPCLNLRVSWVYSSHGTNFVKTILRLAQRRHELSIVGDQIGAPTSAAVIADMTAQVLAGGVDDPAAFLRQHGGEFHLQCEGEASWHEVAVEIIRLAKAMAVPVTTQALKSIPTSDYPTPARRPLNSRLNCSKLINQFGLTPPHWQQALEQSFRTVLESTVREAANEHLDERERRLRATA